MTPEEIEVRRNRLERMATLWFGLALVLAVTAPDVDHLAVLIWHWLFAGLFIRWGVSRIADMPAVPVAPLEAPFGYEDAVDEHVYVRSGHGAGWSLCWCGRLPGDPVHRDSAKAYES